MSVCVCVCVSVEGELVAGVDFCIFHFVFQMKNKGVVIPTNSYLCACVCVCVCV